MADDRSPADLLARSMRRAGHNPNSLASATDGKVSPTTVRSYIAGGKVTASKIASIARVLAERDSIEHLTELLIAYDLADLADGLQETTMDHRPDLPQVLGPLDEDTSRVGGELLSDAFSGVSPQGRRLIAAFAEWVKATEADKH